jgi:hypothetical protein
MNAQLLIDAVVRQTTILIAQLATSGGARTPLADVANQVFVDLSRELHRQGVSRKVAADMFGMALRTYRRKIQRLTESRTVAGRSLWEAVHDFVGGQAAVTRRQVLRHFHHDDEELVRGVLHDLTDSGLIYRAGRGESASYHAATRAELDAVTPDATGTEALDMLVWACVYRLGPLDRDQLSQSVNAPAHDLDAALGRLVSGGKVTATDASGNVRYSAAAYVVPLGKSAGWEAAVFDHFQAVVSTVCEKLRLLDAAPSERDRIGGSTYTLVVWPGHPLEEQALGLLAEFRARISSLREQIATYNRSVPLPARQSHVIAYCGQFVRDHEESLDEEEA